MAAEIGLGEDVVVLQLLEKDVLAPPPIARLPQSQEAEDAAIDGAGVASRAADAESWTPDPILRTLENFRFGPTLELISGHFEIVLARLALDGTGIALHEDIAPIPTA